MKNSEPKARLKSSFPSNVKHWKVVILYRPSTAIDASDTYHVWSGIVNADKNPVL